MDFDFLKEKLESKLNSWKSKCLFRDGRATLIKASAYTKATFRIVDEVL